MTPAKKSPVQSAAQPASKPARGALSLADETWVAPTAPPSVLAYQQRLEDHFADQPEARARYPRPVRVAIVLGGGVAAWAGVILAARFALGLFA